LALDIPPGLISPSKTRQGDRVTDLLEWVKGSTGCGLETLKIELGKVQTHERTVFKKYRLFVRQDSRYQHIRDLYTETEALIPLEAETVERQSERPEQDVEQAQKKVERFPVLTGLRKYALGNERQHLLLAGRPGSGKSTTLQRLLLELAAEGLAESTVIPVYVQLKSDRPIAELICAAFRPAQVRVTPEQLDEWLLQNQLLLLLDGVNEIPSEARRRQLQDFREDNPTTPMIFTTRNLSVGGDLGIAKRLEMRPLSEAPNAGVCGQVPHQTGNA
jgi:Mrp family chromosome partitioning ATPase